MDFILNSFPGVLNMIHRNSSPFYDTTRKTFRAHHIRMYPMFNVKNNSSCINGIGTTLHHRGISKAETNKKDSFAQNLELQRSISLASPRGFLFRLNKGGGVRTQAQDNISKITLKGKRIPGQKDGEFSMGKGGQDVSSIIKCSILQRRTLALTSGNKLKELRIKGEKTLLLKAQRGPQNDLSDVFSVDFRARNKRFDLLPPLAKHKVPEESLKGRRITESKDDSLSLGRNQILPRKPEVSDGNKLEIKAVRETYRTKEKYDKGPIDLTRDEVSLERTLKKRVINVFLPAITTDEQY